MEAQPRGCEVPLVDFSPFCNVPLDAPPPHITREQRSVAAQIDAALRRHGVLFLRNFGLPAAQLHAAFHMTQQLFALPLQHKLDSLKRYDATLSGGYIARGMESYNHRRAFDLKEAYNITDPMRIKPDYSKYPRDFERVSTQFYHSMSNAASRLAIACALALDIPLDTFGRCVKERDLTTVRMMHYPPCHFVRGQSTGDDETSSIRLAEHRDFGFFTFLFVRSAGLQVKRERDACGAHAQSEWMDVPIPPQGCAVVMIGRLAARVTNDVWMAPMHRVVVSDARACDKSRYAVAYFHEPDKRSVIETHPRFCAEGNARGYEPISGGASTSALVEQSLVKKDAALNASDAE